TVEDTINMVGEGITKLVGGLLGDEKSQVKDVAIKRFLDYYSEHLVDHTSIYPHVIETLERLNKFKKAVISNKREFLSIKLLDKLNLLQYLDLVVGSDTTSERKPSSVPVNYVLSRLGMSPDESAIVGDSNYDIEAGKNAGVKTIAVTYGYRERHYLMDADFIIDSLEELPRLLY
ncbi:MAG: HAD-IA family hydrolase, partial [Nitrospirota bacterium]|nr:HAD-IA family hydrolase [Nitrospirota bacterium]